MVPKFLEMENAINLLVEFGDALIEALQENASGRGRERVGIAIPKSLINLLKACSVENGEPVLTTDQVVSIFLAFGHAYVSAAEIGSDKGRQLRKCTQQLLAILTNRAASRIDIDAVFPLREIPTDC